MAQEENTPGPSTLHEPPVPREPPPCITACLVDAQQQFSTIHLSEILRRTTDNLPDYVKGSVEWRRYHTHGPGYYLLNPDNNHYDPVEFFYGHWYDLCYYTEKVFTSEATQIPPYSRGTGYWLITDWRNPENTSERDYYQVIATEAAEAAISKDPTSFKSANKEARERYSYIQEYLRENERQKHTL